MHFQNASTPSGEIGQGRKTYYEYARLNIFQSYSLGNPYKRYSKGKEKIFSMFQQNFIQELQSLPFGEAVLGSVLMMGILKDLIS